MNTQQKQNDLQLENHMTISVLEQQEEYLEIWVSSWLKAKKTENLSIHTILYYENTIRTFVQYCNNQSLKYISQITPSFIREYLEYLQSSGHNSGGIHSLYRALKVFLRWIENEEIMDNWRNPISKIKAPKKIVEVQEGITSEQFETLLSVCTRYNFLGERNRCILMMLMDTGVRASELTDITLKNVNIIESSIFIPLGKGRKARTVFFGSRTRKQLRKYLKYRGKEGSYLFVNRSSEKLTYNSLREILRRLCRLADIKDISLHDFRRGFSLSMLNNGIEPVTISRLLGHSNLNQILTYTRQKATDIQSKYKSVIDD